MVAGETAPPTPGHVVPVGVELSSADSVEAWLAAMGYAASKVSVAGSVATYSEALVELGYDDMFTLNFTEAELVEEGVKRRASKSPRLLRSSRIQRNPGSKIVRSGCT